jgi:hypothetical protein
VGPRCSRDRAATEFHHSRPQRSAQAGDGSQRIAIYRCDCANHDRKVFLSAQKHTFLETRDGAGTFRCGEITPLPFERSER